ncbi:MAG: MBL fold metallo-hydrolase, partial [Bradymonadaceae bacterium]
MTSTDAREPPADDEFEVSNFGPGVGECCLVHLGDGEWFVVDSCRTDDGVPVSEWYLERLGLDPAEAVSGILVTHWHDDHVDGVADLLSTCNSATFYCSAAYRTEEFLTFIETGRDAQFGPSGTDELRAVLELLKERRSDGQRAASAGPELVKENE